MISTRFHSLPVRGTLVLLSAVAGLLGTGCAAGLNAGDSFLGFITPYRMEIVQGNAITREQVALVKPGMTREQVQAALGTPMLTDPFHADRWDYFFALRRPGTAPQKRVVVARFKDGTLERLEAPDDLPTETDFVASVVPVRKNAQVPELMLTEAQRAALPPVTPRPPEEAAKPAGPVRTYPPLEPR